MSKIFEDAFTDAQANMVSLSLDLLTGGKKEVDKIYMYAYHGIMRYTNPDCGERYPRQA